MLQSISKKKIYFYLWILILLSSTFNFNIISNFNKLNLIKHINIVGLNEKEKNILEKNLKILINKNIFLINKDEAEKILNNNSFIDTYKIVKVFPSNLLVNVKKTKFVGKTILDGEKFYIGKNGKLTKISLVEKEYNLPQVFGSFEAHEFLNLQEILLKNSFNLDKIKKYYYYKSKRWDIENNDNVLIRLPSENIENSLTKYRSLMKTNKIIKSNLIDLRIKNKIIFTYEKK
tara:strand:- start:5735 stop:6430 length:696 start_codon:yes stop_codon:yes gene_type:complete